MKAGGGGSSGAEADAVGIGRSPEVAVGVLADGCMGLGANTPGAGSSVLFLICTLLMNSRSDSISVDRSVTSILENIVGGNGEGDLGNGSTRVSGCSGLDAEDEG